MKTAVIYARYSSDNQSEQSIEGQVRVCNEYAQHNDILIVDSYIDRAMTGTNDHRPEFQRMISDSSQKKWDYVIVYKLDRFSRDKYETVMHRKTLRDNGVKLLSAMENIPDTPEGIILEGLLESMNQYFSAELSQKTKRGMRENRIKGYSQGGKTLYGYKVENKKILINEEEAAVVRYMYERYDAGDYAKDIVSRLQAKGITKRGKPFAKSTVYRMLVMEQYTGIYRFGNEVYKNMYPQIIDKELFARVKAKADSLKHGGLSIQTNYLFSRKLFCGYCGKNMNGNYGISRTGNRKYYYRCAGQRGHNPCIKTSVNKDKLELFVIRKVIGELNKPEVMKKLIDRLLTIQGSNSKIYEQLNVLEQEKQKAQRTHATLMKNVRDRVVPQSVFDQITEVEEQLATIEKAIITEKSKIDTSLKREQLEKYYSEALERNGKEIVGLLVKIVRLYNDKIEITFNSPLKYSPDDNQGSFYDTTFENPFNNKTMEPPFIKANYYVYS